MPENQPDASAATSHDASRRRLYAVPVVLVVAAIVIAGAVISRSDSEESPLPSTSPLTGDGTTTTATAISTRTEVSSRLEEILSIRDKALLERDAELLSNIYTADCKCLKDGRALIRQLVEENVVWRGVRTSVTIRSMEEVNKRLWEVVASVATPSVRVETESGQLIRIVPPERNLVRFALAKPQNEQEWLLGHASIIE